MLFVSDPVTAQAQAPAPTEVAPAPSAAPGTAPLVASEEAPTEPTAPEPVSAAARQSLGNAIQVDPGATCLTPDILVRRVERWLEKSRVDARIRVHVKGDPEAADRVAFVIDRGDGSRAERQIDDAPADCDQLHSALALSIALAIDASVLGGGSIEVPPDDEVVEPEPSAPAGPSYFRAAVALQGQSSSGLLTDIGLGAGARLELGFVPWLDLRLGGTFGLVTDQRVGEVSGTFDAQLVAGRADACGVARVMPALRLLGCASFFAGAFRTAGAELTESESDVEPWHAAGAGLEVQAQLAGPLWVAASVDLVVPLLRRRIVVLDTSGQPLAERDLTSAGVLVGAGPIFRFF